jgi:ComF family protein
VFRLPALEHVPALDVARPDPGPWRRWAGTLLDLVFPPFCPVCRAHLGEGRRDPLCGTCWSAMGRVAPPWCRRCGLPFASFLTPAWGSAGAMSGPPQMNNGQSPGLPAGELGAGAMSGPPQMNNGQFPGLPAGERGPLCGACRRRPPGFDYARAAARYDGVVREALHAFKFRGRWALAAPLGDLLVEAVAGRLPEGVPDLLLPVPLHPRRERERGFNQASLLARRVGRSLGCPVREAVLTRVVVTRFQTELDAAARRANVRNAFEVRRPDVVAGRHVVLVDDVLTTGATLSECAGRLRAAGASRVGALTVARVTRPGSAGAARGDLAPSVPGSL